MQYLGLAVGLLLLVIGVILHLAAWIVQIVDAFKASTGWGLASLFGAIFLGGIPNLIFCLAKIKERWVPLAMLAGSFPPILVGAMIAAAEAGLIFSNA